MIEIIMENIALSFAYLLSDEDGHFEMITVLMASYLIPRFIYFAFSESFVPRHPKITKSIIVAYCIIWAVLAHKLTQISFVKDDVDFLGYITFVLFPLIVMIVEYSFRESKNK